MTRARHLSHLRLSVCVLCSLSVCSDGIFANMVRTANNSKTSDE